jgi:ABC-type dipeptide/oligopeptide/nickel transport system permease component
MRKKSQINLLNYILRRVIVAVPALLGLVTIIFFLSRAIPGDPVLYRIPTKALGTLYDVEREKLGLNQPIFIQYIKFMYLMFTGDWGFSLGVQPDIEVWTLLWLRLPRTLEIVTISMLIAAFLGIKAGKIAATNRNRFKDVIIRFVIYIAMAIPGFVVATFIITFFESTRIKIFPFYSYKSIGIGDPPTITYIRTIDCILSGNFVMLFDYLYHLFIPICTMVIIQLVIIARQTRSSMIDILQMDYIRTAIAKGVDLKTIYKKHALKNAIPPVITKIMMGFPTLLGTMIPVEVALELKGLGQYFAMAMFYLDYSVIIAMIFAYGVIVIVFNLLADILYGVVDPRIRYT